MKSIRSDCDSPCATMQVSAKGNNITPAKSGKPQLVLYFQSRIQIGTEHYLYTLLSFFAEVGGYVSLILGYSLLNIAEVIVAAFDKKLRKLIHFLCIEWDGRKEGIEPSQNLF